MTNCFLSYRRSNTQVKKIYKGSIEREGATRSSRESEWRRLRNHRGLPLALLIALGLSGAAAIKGQVPQVGQMVTNRLTVPYGGAWIPGNLGGHWWQSDNALGVCRIDPAPAG